MPETLRVNVFNTSSNLPLMAAIEAGDFAAEGLNIEVQHTPNSDEQRAGLAAGRFEIAHAAVDNAVALIESGTDAVIVCGGDAGLNDFMVRPEITGFADLRGKKLAVDAPNTAYALAAKKILKSQGLMEGRDYALKLAGGTGPRAAAMASDPELACGLINPPFNFKLRAQGLKSLGSQFDLLGPYQATGAYVMRPWAQAHAGVLVRYLRAYIRSQRRVMDRAHKRLMLALLTAHFKLEGAAAEGTYEALLTPGSGLAPEAAFNHAGFAQVLAIRAEMEGMWGGVPPDPARYIDLSYDAQARQGV
jgi:ABC-type nitrate/sulfonate/bicarbonate transport system substrate-binding protein